MSKQSEEKDALAEKARLKDEAENHKKGSIDALKENDKNAPNGPEGAQKWQPLPEGADVKATAEPTSKPQNTQKSQKKHEN